MRTKFLVRGRSSETACSLIQTAEHTSSGAANRQCAPDAVEVQGTILVFAFLPQLAELTGRGFYACQQLQEM